MNAYTINFYHQVLPDPLGERSPLPVPPSLWPALEEFGRLEKYF